MTNPEHCVFCALYDGSIEASTVVRNEHVMAAMTIRPLHVGHVLLFPKAHVEDFALLDQTRLGYLFHVGARLKHLAASWTRPLAKSPDG
jgi:histidine triad (HIT) family protein